MTTAADPRNLDERIRALVALAVEVAPEPPDLDTPAPVLAPAVPMRRRRWVPVAVVAAAAAVVVLLAAVVATDSTDRRIAAVPTTPATEPSLPAAWPDGVDVLLASERGVERVTAEGGQPVVQRTAFDEPATFAIGLADGSVVLQQAPELGDYGVIRLVRPSGDGAVVANLASSTLIDADVVDGRVRALYGTPAADRGPEVRRVWLWVDGETSVWNDVFASVERQFRLRGEPAMVEFPDELADLTAVATHVDVHDGFAAISVADGPGVLVDRRSAVRYLLPAAGTATIVRRSISNLPVVPPPADLPFGVLTAGPEGVWEIGPDDGAQLTTEPMAIALRMPDDSIVLQRRSGWGEGWTQGDTVPLVWRSGGTIEELLPGVDWAPDVWIRVHDVAEVDGRTVLLYEVQHTPDPADPAAGSLVAYVFDTAETTVLDENFGDWQRPVQRFHVTAAGTVVGAVDDPDCVTMLAYSLPGSDATVPQAASLVGTCARAVAVDRSGNLLAWVEGTELVVVSWADGREVQRVDLGDDVEVVSGLALGDGYAVVERSAPSGQQLVPLLVRFGIGTVTVHELSGVTATIG